MKGSIDTPSSFQHPTFQIIEISQARFDVPYHFHAELELTLIISGKGKRFVGNQVSDFGPGDLVLLGQNVPHCWQNYRENLLIEEDPKGSQALVIQFHKDFFRLRISRKTGISIYQKIT